MNTLLPSFDATQAITRLVKLSSKYSYLAKRLYMPFIVNKW